MSPVQVQKIQTLTGHRDCVYTLQAGSDSYTVFSASGDGMVVQWDLQNPENGTLIAKLPNSVYALQYHSPSGMLIAGQNYEGIHLLDWQNKREAASLKLTTAAIFDIQYRGDELFLATGDGEIVIVNLASLRIINRLKVSEKNARTIALNPVSGDIAVGFSDNQIRVFDGNLKLKHEFSAHEKSVFTIRFTPDNRYLMSGSRDARLKIWDSESGYALAGEVVAHMYAINHLDFSPDGKHFVTCSMDKSIKVWDLHKLQLLKVIDKSRHAGHGTSVNKLLWTSYNNQLLSASDDRTISVWHIIF
ncbi:MAG TPA: WD40 repeat domain-containing protein [Chryseosolibacter sp.]|nr:WD40 repeat domain-containing protein [Chryseosolibacter sp.]